MKRRGRSDRGVDSRGPGRRRRDRAAGDVVVRARPDTRPRFRQPPVDRRTSSVPKSGAPVAMNLRPLHDRVIVRRLTEGEQKSGRIIIPDSAKEKPQRGEVIAAGAGKIKKDGGRVPLDIKAGDMILFGKYTSQEVKLDGEEYLIMREDEVLAVIDAETKKKK